MQKMTEFHANKWPSGKPETISGTGSMLKHTVSIRNSLPEIFSQYNIRSFFDAPCGDGNWIKSVDFGNTLYSGGDVSADVCKHNTMPNIQTFDIRSDTPPDVDMWFCRDCLYHMSISDIQASIRNMRSGNIRYFLLTTHLQKHLHHPRNTDIATGGFRILILKEHDYFGLPQPIGHYADSRTGLDEDMLLFDLEQS